MGKRRRKSEPKNRGPLLTRPPLLCEMTSNHQQQVQPDAETLPDEKVEMVAAMLKVLSDATRIRLIEVLNDLGSATVSTLTAYVSVSQPGVSKHLAILYQAGIVSRRRQGMWVRYELADFTCCWIVQQLVSGLAGSSSRSAS
jgi:DNA-binding transcriptional ArsR family regulator